MVPRLFAVLTLSSLLLGVGCASPSAQRPPSTEAPKAAAPAPTGTAVARPADGRSAPLAAPAAPAAAAPAPAARPAEAAKPATQASATAGGQETSQRGLAAADAARAAAPAAPAAPPASGTDASKAAAGQPAASLPAVLVPNRMIIFTTDITLLVKSVDDAVRAIGDLAVLNGGYVAGVENTVDQGVPVSTVRIKVLPDRYTSSMNSIRQLGLEVRAEKATTQDVTEEYSDVQTQLASLEAAHKQLLDILAKATTMDEILKIQQQAAQIKLQIDRLRGRATVLERLSELATITARLQPAEAFLGKDYTAVRGQLRQAELQYAAQLIALERARTPEEENAIRDKLGELSFQIDRSRARLKDIEQKATQAGIALPSAPSDQAGQPASPGSARKDLPQQYIDARVAIRRAQLLQDELTRQLKSPASLPADEQAKLRKQLSESILELNTLNTQLRTIQERMAQLGVPLPNLTPEQEALLAGTPVEVTQPDPWWKAIASAWESSLLFLRNVAVGLLSAVAFLWWAILAVGFLGMMLFRRGIGRPAWPARRPTPAATAGAASAEAEAPPA